MDPGVRCHGMKANYTGKLCSSKPAGRESQAHFMKYTLGLRFETKYKDNMLCVEGNNARGNIIALVLRFERHHRIVIVKLTFKVSCSIV